MRGWVAGTMEFGPSLRGTQHNEETVGPYVPPAAQIQRGQRSFVFAVEPLNTNHLLSAMLVPKPLALKRRFA